MRLGNDPLPLVITTERESPHPGTLHDAYMKDLCSIQLYFSTPKKPVSLEEAKEFFSAIGPWGYEFYIKEGIIRAW
jgi:hypothetical protein